jgi:adenine/guanine phosphoribosyltransferase-like PRPP-binding protein
MLIEKMFYNDTLFRSQSLRDWANLYLKYIPKKCKIIITQGSSGAVLAAAIMVLAPERDFRHISISKKIGDRHADTSNGCSTLEGIGYHGELLVREAETYEYKYRQCVIVDDFTETGSTMERIVSFTENVGLKIKAIIVESVGAVSDKPHWFVDYKIIQLGKKEELGGVR